MSIFLPLTLILILLAEASAFATVFAEPHCNRLTASKLQRQRPVRHELAAATDDGDKSENLRRDSFGRQLRGLQLAGLKKKMQVGDTVVCRKDLTSSGIYENMSFELQSIYAQRFNAETQQIEKVTLPDLDESSIPIGYTDRYVTLFSPAYHAEPVLVSPEEVGITSVRSEIISSLWLSIPGTFWVFVCAAFYNVYHEKTGGSFLDAFWGK